MARIIYRGSGGKNGIDEKLFRWGVILILTGIGIWIIGGALFEFVPRFVAGPILGVGTGIMIVGIILAVIA